MTSVQLVVLHATYQEYACVVINMKEAQLFPSLFRNNERCVQKVQDFGKVKHVQNERNGRVLLVEVIAR